MGGVVWVVRIALGVGIGCRRMHHLHYLYIVDLTHVYQLHQFFSDPPTIFLFPNSRPSFFWPDEDEEKHFSNIINTNLFSDSLNPNPVCFFLTLIVILYSLPTHFSNLISLSLSLSIYIYIYSPYFIV